MWTEAKTMTGKIEEASKLETSGERADDNVWQVHTAQTAQGQLAIGTIGTSLLVGHVLVAVLDH